MFRPHRSLLLCLIATAAMLPLLTGCQQKPEVAKKVEPRYPNVGRKKVPEFMAGTIYERVEVGNTDPFPVSGWGLMVNLDHTGNNEGIPSVVKQYMIKVMVTQGFGSKLTPGYENIMPEAVLKDDRVAIVQVEGLLPPGTHKNQSFDVIVRAVRGTATSSLAHGQLYLTDLSEHGTSSPNPFASQSVNSRAQAKGFVFVNPAYALIAGQNPTGAAKAALRSGVIMDGGLAVADRPILLQLRQPQTSVSRAIEQRIIGRFGDPLVASAHDEALISVFVPPGYGADWQHFLGVVLHTYLNSSPEFAAAKARQLVEVAQTPDAPLMDISFCWEGIGPPALPFVAPLLVSHQKDVQFAAARAAACIGDPSGAASATLLEIARDSDNPYQLAAVQTLGSLPHSAAVDHMLRELLDSEKALVRIEAYKILARDQDASVYSRVITERPTNQKFILDIVPSKGSPLIYATRTGTPRIGILGTTPRIDTPIVFMAMNNRLSISSGVNPNVLTLFYRDPMALKPVNMLSNPDIGEIIARLGGVSAETEQPLDFSYCEIVAILQSLSQQHKLTAVLDGQIAMAPFVLQDPSRLQAAIYNTPSMEGDRPQSDPKPAAAGVRGTLAKPSTAPADNTALLTGRPQ